MSREGALATRIKRYEAASDYILTPRSCLFVRVDGKSFHTYTRGCDRPFDRDIMDAMDYAMYRTATQMQGFKLAYTQSDECTFVLTDFDTHQTQGWFGYELNKVVSISASMFTAYFNDSYLAARSEAGDDKPPALFDSRAFIVPLDDAPNVFVWRQQDWVRNSVQMLARAHFSHKELDGKRVPDMHEMLHGKGINWATDISDRERNGSFYANGRDARTLNAKLDYDELLGLIQPVVPE